MITVKETIDVVDFAVQDGRTGEILGARKVNEQKWMLEAYPENWMDDRQPIDELAEVRGEEQFMERAVRTFAESRWEQ